MWNLYSITKTQCAMHRLFKVDRRKDRLGNQQTLPAVFPSHDAPVIRKAEDGERELVRLNWGFVPPQEGRVAKRVARC